MRLFGDPRYPRRNLRVAALLLALTWFRVGGILEHTFTPESTTKDYIALTIWLALALLTVAYVRRSLAALPVDPQQDGSNSRRPGSRR